MILPARLLYGALQLLQKILRHVNSILMHILITIGIKNYRFQIEIIML